MFIELSKCASSTPLMIREVKRVRNEPRAEVVPPFRPSPPAHLSSPPNHTKSVNLVAGLIKSPSKSRILNAPLSSRLEIGIGFGSFGRRLVKPSHKNTPAILAALIVLIVSSSTPVSCLNVSRIAHPKDDNHHTFTNHVSNGFYLSNDHGRRDSCRMERFRIRPNQLRRGDCKSFCLLAC